ncbi:MAG: hypothetical protein K2W96_25740 [Gemmataceae bacterium]|nr:hypothetical protein [Gemmataceae bacterium]
MAREMLAALAFAGLAQAAPMPGAPQAAAECAFDAGTPQRAAALWQFVQSPEFAKRAGLVGAKVRADNLGTTIRFGVYGLREVAALEAARRAAEAVTAEPGKEEMALLLQAAQNARRYYDDEWGGRARFRRRIIRRGDIEYIRPELQPIHEIRLNRPTLKAAPRLVAR